MSSALYIVIAGLVVTTPLTQALAQAQDSATVETVLLREQPVIWVPAAVPELASQWPVAPPNDRSTAYRIFVVVVLVALVAVLVLYAVGKSVEKGLE